MKNRLTGAEVEAALVETGMSADEAAACSPAILELDRWPAPPTDAARGAELAANLITTARRTTPAARSRLVRASLLGALAAVLLMATAFAAEPNLRNAVAGWFNQPPTVRSPLVLGSVDFLTPRIGYVTVGNTRTHRGFLYKTVDGGRSWRFLLRFPTSGVEPNMGLLGTSLNFLNANVGYLYFASGKTSLPEGGTGIYGMLERTSDGGTTWHGVKLPHERWQSFISLSFVSQAKGWALISSGTTMGQAVSALFQTSDAGRTWKKVAWDYWSRRMVWESKDGLGGSWNQRIHFVNSRYGWLISDGEVIGAPVDSVTVDGGRSWRACRSLPAQGSARRPRRIIPPYTCVGPIAPAKLFRESLRSWGSSEQVFVTQLDRGDFFGRIGLLPVMDVVPRSRHGVVLPPDQGAYLMYRLNLKRTGWSKPLNLPLGFSFAGAPPATDIESPRDWFFAADGHIVLTLDGGKSWTRLRSPIPARYALGGIRFFNDRVGLVWGGSINQNGPYSPRSALDLTTDGGRTWRTIRLPIR